MSNTSTAPPDSDEIEQLRTDAYNATLIDRIDVHEDLALFRVQPDAGLELFQPGQYMTLGLGNWEPRIEGAQQQILPPAKIRKVVRRAYSIACPMLDANDQLTPCRALKFYEFYITLVRRAAEPPAFTPRLFELQQGARLQAARRIVGTYTLDGVGSEDDVVFFGTGTGEAPHNSMAAELLSQGHRGRIINATCVRLRRDLAYLATHQRLSEQFNNYQYMHFTTRELENTNPNLPGFVGKQHLQHVVQSGQFESTTGVQLDPKRVHVFLCGNPAMIGYQKPGSPPQETPGMLQILQQRGFQQHDPHQPAGPGHVRFEKYW